MHIEDHEIGGTMMILSSILELHQQVKVISSREWEAKEEKKNIRKRVKMRTRPCSHGLFVLT